MYSHILVPIAMDHKDHAQDSLAVARQLLSATGTITLLNVIEDIPAFAQSYFSEDVMKENEAAIHLAMEGLAEKAGADCSAAVAHGKSSTAILEYASGNDVDCIVIASHKPGLEDYFIGSTAARVVRHARCCVHVLR